MRRIDEAVKFGESNGRILLWAENQSVSGFLTDRFCGPCIEELFLKPDTKHGETVMSEGGEHARGPSHGERSVIVDTKMVLWNLLGSIFFVPSFLWVLVNVSWDTALGFWLFVICGAAAAYNVALLIARAPGYVFDEEQNEFVFPGGGKVAKTVTDYFDPRWHLERFTRHTVPLCGVAMIERKTDVQLNRGFSLLGILQWLHRITEDRPRYTGLDQTRKTRVDVAERLYITGDFGAFNLTISSQEKAKEIYDKLRRLNRMGDPIFMT